MVNQSVIRTLDVNSEGHIVPDVARALATGGAAVIVDDGHAEDVGHLVMAAEFADWKSISFFVQHTSGFLCAAMPSDRAETLNLPAMVPDAEERVSPAFAVAVDARDGITTGISARDRARTMCLLADSTTTTGDLCRPGHVMPIRTHTDGVRSQAQLPEAAVDLCRLAGVAPVAVVCAIVADDGSLLKRGNLVEFARTHHLPVAFVQQLVTYRRRREARVEAVEASKLPTAFGIFTAHAYRNADGAEHLVLVMGDFEQTAAPLVRVHSECLTCEVLGSLGCDCGTRLTDSLRIIGEAGTGVLVYLRGHEARGTGLASKVAAYRLQDQSSCDTVDADIALGKPAGGSSYVDAALILADLRIRQIRVLTNNTDNCRAMMEAGIEVVEQVTLPPSARSVF